MKCHYEVLGLEFDATDAEIKKAYRKQALVWHPDKNMHRIEEATNEFQLVQAANTVLSDPQERKWYDDHRDAILRGGTGMNPDGSDTIIDLMGYFDISCYTGFGNDDEGFYHVYSEAFEKIFDCEQYVMEGAPPLAPIFGNRDSDYDSVVRKFYGFWMSFTSMNAFAYCDKWDTRDAPDRRVKRMMEKENKKLRENAKKEHVQTVRQLVAFVRKRDKRVLAKLKLAKEEKERKAVAVVEKKKLQKKEEAERIKELQNSEEYKDHRKALEEEFAALKSGFSDDDDGDESEQTGTFCVACHKGFKSDKQYSNHQKSKKHLAAVKALKVELKNDEVWMELEGEIDDDDDDDDDEVEENVGEGAFPLPPDYVEPDSDASDDSFESCEENSTEKSKTSDNNNNNNNSNNDNNNITDNADNSDDDDDDDDDDDTFARFVLTTQTKRNGKGKSKSKIKVAYPVVDVEDMKNTVINVDTDDDDDDEVGNDDSDEQDDDADADVGTTSLADTDKPITSSTTSSSTNSNTGSTNSTSGLTATTTDDTPNATTATITTAAATDMGIVKKDIHNDEKDSTRAKLKHEERGARAKIRKR